MRFACVMGFEVDVEEDRKEAVLSDLGQKITTASGRLGIGFGYHFIAGQPQPLYSKLEEFETDPVTLFETP